MKSTRFIFIFAAVSLLLHLSLFLIRLEPAEPQSHEAPPQKLIPVDLAFKSSPEALPAAEPEAVFNPKPQAAAKPSEAPAIEKASLPVTAPETRPEPEPETPPEPAAEPESEAPPPQPAVSAAGGSTAAVSSERNAENTTAGSGANQNPFEGLLGRIDQNKKSTYPLSARKKGYQGTVYIQLVLDADGNLISSEIVAKSSHSSLNSAALKLIDKVMETPYPHNLGRNVSLKIPITYKLD